jgi:hypothetical protein
MWYTRIPRASEMASNGPSSVSLLAPGSVEERRLNGRHYRRSRLQGKLPTYYTCTDRLCSGPGRSIGSGPCLNETLPTGLIRHLTPRPSLVVG